MAAGRKQSLGPALGACLALLFHVSSAAVSHTVGDATGWTIPPSPTYYNSWASKQTFHVGDFLVFDFVSGKQSVAEVTKPDYDSCATATPLIQINNGPANLTISTPTTHYYISTVPGHCTAGQKLAVTATALSPPSPVAPSPKSGTPSGSTPAAPSPKSGTPATPPAAPTPKTAPAPKTASPAVPAPETTPTAAPTPKSPAIPTPTSPTTPAPTPSATTSPGSSPASAPSSMTPTGSPGTLPSSGGPAASPSAGGPGTSPSAGGPAAAAGGSAGGPAGGPAATAGGPAGGPAGGAGALTPAGEPAPGTPGASGSAAVQGGACWTWTLLLIAGAHVMRY